MASVSTLYTRDILRLASSLPVVGRLPHADGEAERRSFTCGSRVLASVRMDPPEADNARVVEAALEAHSCALGQASAAILLAHAAGMSHADLADLRARIAVGLSGEGAWPIDWPELSHLAPTQAYPARHAAILLPYDALIAAMLAAMERAG